MWLCEWLLFKTRLRWRIILLFRISTGLAHGHLHRKIQPRQAPLRRTLPEAYIPSCCHPATRCAAISEFAHLLRKLEQGSERLQPQRPSLWADSAQPATCLATPSARHWEQAVAADKHGRKATSECGVVHLQQRREGNAVVIDEQEHRSLSGTSASDSQLLFGLLNSVLI